MSSAKKREHLTNSALVNLLMQELEKFSDDYYPLHSSQLNAIKRCRSLVGIDDSEVGDNTTKRRARIILVDLWTHSPEAFLLCSLAITPSHLGTLKSTDYMKDVIQRWENVEVPRGITKTFDRHSDALPSTSRDQRQVSVKVSFGALLKFLHQRFGDQEVEMSLPFSGKPLPSVRLDTQAKIELSWDLANSFTRQH